MNKERRKELSSIIDRIAALGAKIDEVKQIRDEIVSDLESVRDAEQEAFDNLPESLQDGERGQDMQLAIENLKNSLQDLESVEDMDADSIVGNIDDARGQA